MAKQNNNSQNAKQSKKQPGSIPAAANSVAQNQNRARREKPISGAHGPIDTDLARDNLENDLPAAELDDL